MKILNAWVDDPTLSGHLSPPILAVETDEPPEVTIPLEDFAGGWRVGKFGPFVNYSQQDSPDGPPAAVNAGDFNVRFRNRFPVVVDIQLFTPDHKYEGFSLPLSRARQLIRKHDRRWRLLINDREGEAGRLMWIPVETDPQCRWWKQSDICGDKPARMIRVRNVDLPMCAEHIEQHNKTYASRRAARSS